jgi:hypothetical protein
MTLPKYAKLRPNYYDEWLASRSGWLVQVPTEPAWVERIRPAAETGWTSFRWNRRTLDAVLATQTLFDRNGN